MNRRRFLALVAASGAIAASPARAFRLDPVEWRGVAMGAPARLVLHHEDRAAALALLAECEAELTRLERVFSLYRPDSALSRLNSRGGLEAPPLDLVQVLSQAGQVWRQSDGLFDPTVQPLWDLHARHFARADADPRGPSAAQLEAVRGAVGWSGLSMSPERITLRPGMALTLNGIAQGYAADCMAALLRRHGMRHALVDMGEVAALGRRGDGRAWSARTPDGATRFLSHGGLAVSMADGTRFSPLCHHLFDPLAGRCAPPTAAIVVQAPSATLADAISTAIAVSGGRLTTRDFGDLIH